jgi:hypothetical protein
MPKGGKRLIMIKYKSTMEKLVSEHASAHHVFEATWSPRKSLDVYSIQSRVYDNREDYFHTEEFEDVAGYSMGVINYTHTNVKSPISSTEVDIDALCDNIPAIGLYGISGLKDVTPFIALNMDVLFTHHGKTRPCDGMAFIEEVSDLLVQKMETSGGWKNLTLAERSCYMLINDLECYFDSVYQCNLSGAWVIEYGVALAMTQVIVEYFSKGFMLFHDYDSIYFIEGDDAFWSLLNDALYQHLGFLLYSGAMERED